MALPININDLINKRIVESSRIEYKANWNPEPVMHSICAFANDIDNWGGGYIIIGIEEKNGIPVFPVTGITKDSVDSINKELVRICNFIEQRYLPVSEAVDFGGKQILVLWIPGGLNRPYKCPVNIADPSNKAYYIRKFSSTIKANAAEEKALFALSESIPFDDMINPKANIEDLRPALIGNFLYEVKSNLYSESKTMDLRDLVLNMKIADGPIEYTKPLNVGLMFFNERPDNFFKYARIEVVYKPDPTGTGMFEQSFYGPLDTQLRSALTYIRGVIVKEKTIKYHDRAEADRFSNFPYPAIEEALANAVHHKSYQYPAPIVVTATPEQLDILSLPGPDKSITAENLRTFKMISGDYRNRRIGEFLKELRLVEGRNTGIPAILKAMKNNGSDLPVFETNDDRTYFRVIFPIHKSFLEDRPPESQTSKVPLRRKRSDLKELILTVLSSAPLTTKELSTLVGYSSSKSGTFLGLIKELMLEGKIAYTIPDNPHDVNQKLCKLNDSPESRS
jgi:ATP-dependent DNA helicase RecG